MSRTVARMSEAGIIFGTLPWLYLTMRSGQAGPDEVYWLPLSDLVRLAAGPLGFLAVQVVGNLLVFAAAGFLLPVRFAAFRSVPRVMAVATAGSLTIELIQLFAHHGRVFSVDDIWLNAVGAGLAAVASRRWWASRVIKPGVSHATRAQ